MANLIVYYSRKGQNYINGSIENLSRGNTEIVAEFIREAVGGEMFEVETEKPYSNDYYKCTEEAKRELENNARPVLRRYLRSAEEYDVVFVGFPNWWGTMPMAMFSLLENCDFAGKTIFPFCTNEGSGMGYSERDLAKICTGAKIEKGLPVRGASAAASRKMVAEWAKKSVENAEKGVK